MKLLAWLRRHWVPLVVPVGLYLLTRTYHTAPFAHARAKFTLGTVSKWYDRQGGSRAFTFRFAVRDTAYEGTRDGFAQPTDALGRRCLVEYDSLAPQGNIGHLDVPVPDSLQQAPANGWRAPPFAVPTWVLGHSKNEQKQHQYIWLNLERFSEWFTGLGVSFAHEVVFA